MGKVFVEEGDKRTRGEERGKKKSMERGENGMTLIPNHQYLKKHVKLHDTYIYDALFERRI